LYIAESVINVKVVLFFPPQAGKLKQNKIKHSHCNLCRSYGGMELNMKYNEILPYIEGKLRGGGIDPKECATEARIIAESVAGVSFENIQTYPDGEILEGRVGAVNKTVSDRVFKRIPLQYLLGEWEFYGNRMKVGEGVLIPRPETEMLVTITRNFFDAQENTTPKIIDLCTGTGCIAISLKKIYPYADVRAVEMSTQAFPYISFNEKLNDVTIITSRGDATKESALQNFKDNFGTQLRFDAIVCNPPYLSKLEMNNLQPELKYEPEMALLGGLDGLDFFRVIPNIWKKALRPGGMLLFEMGDTQAGEVNKCLKRAGFTDIKIFNDDAGHKRAIAGFLAE
jgi:release factor glutamine methyltransferase